MVPVLPELPAVATMEGRPLKVLVKVVVPLLVLTMVEPAVFSEDLPAIFVQDTARRTEIRMMSA